MGLSLLMPLEGRLFGLAETWVEAKQERETAKVKNQIVMDEAKTQAAITVVQKDADATNNIDLISVKNQRFTWTDEYIKVLFTLPFALMFLPWTQEYVIAGFQAFTLDTPDWYKYVIYAIVISELGLRRVFMKLFDTVSTLRTGGK